jgi:hypothetical protein
LKHGIFCFLKHGKLEDALFECFRDALRSQITQGAADLVINSLHNLLSSILSTVNMEGDRNEGRLINGDNLNVDDRSLDEGCQPDGITVYGGRLDREIFPSHVEESQTPIKTGTV